MRIICLLLFLITNLSISCFAQGEVDAWEKKKAEQFKPLTADQQAAIAKAIPGELSAKPKRERRILVFYRCEGFVHNSIPFANFAFQEMGRKTGAFAVDLADSYDVFDKENLKKYDGILLNNTTGMVFPDIAQQNAFLDFVANGKGLVGIHAASDNFGRHPECRALIGGQFAGHPWNADGNWAFKLDDPSHVLNQAFEGKGFWNANEIYQYGADSYVGPKVLRLLVSLDMSKGEVTKQINDGPREVPVSWIRKAGDGRVFYTNFGHREDTFQNPALIKHILDGIQFSLGDLAADSVPTAESPRTKIALAPDKP